MSMRIGVAVCGGIAAYKAAELVRLLQQDAFDVEVAMTRAAQEFVQPLTFAALTGHRVITSLWQREDDAAEPMEHISFSQRTAAIVVAPATADMLAKFANGIADDFVSTALLASTAPVILAPAMNVNMWNHAATQHNLATLRGRGAHIVEPGAGYLACGMIGEGRMAEPAEIAAAVRHVLLQQRELEGETVLVTAGGTREPIDPVRFLGNRSSGKMGFAIAAEAARRGARVVLIAGPTSLPAPAGCERVDVLTAEEMRNEVMQHLREATIVIKAAAVSDFRPAQVANEKIKREGELSLKLEPTPDILAEVAKSRNESTLVVGFAAETSNVQQNARAKFLRKGLDAIVVNDVSQRDIGFDGDDNAVTLISPAGEVEFPRMPKSQLAAELLTHIARLRAARVVRV